MLYRIILASRSTTFKSMFLLTLWTISVKRVLSLNETDSRLKETIWRQTKFQLKHAWSQKSQGDSHHSGPSQFSGTEQQLLWEVPVELLLWPSLNHAGHTTFHSLKDRATFHSPFLILFSGRQLSKKTKCSDRDKTKERLLPFCKRFVFWEELSVLLLWLTKKQLEKITSLKQQLPEGFTSEYFQALGFGHILFYNKRVGKHNTRSGQCETCIWRTHYHKGIFSRFSARKFCFTRTWLGEKNWLTRMTKTVIRILYLRVFIFFRATSSKWNNHSKLCLRSISRNSRGLFPNALRSMSSHFSIDSSSRRNCRSVKRVPFYTSFISSTKNFGAIMTSCGFQYIPSHHEM